MAKVNSKTVVKALVTKAVKAVKPQAPPKGAQGASKPVKASKPTPPPSKLPKGKQEDEGDDKPARKPAAKPTNTVEESAETTVSGLSISVTPVQGRGGNRVTVDGHNITALLRWCGLNGWTVARARVLLGKLPVKTLGKTLAEIVGLNTVNCQIHGHTSPCRGPIAEVSNELRKVLVKLAPES